MVGIRVGIDLEMTTKHRTARRVIELEDRIKITSGDLSCVHMCIILRVLALRLRTGNRSDTDTWSFGFSSPSQNLETTPHYGVRIDSIQERIIPREHLRM